MGAKFIAKNRRTGDTHGSTCEGSLVINTGKHKMAHPKSAQRTTHESSHPSGNTWHVPTKFKHFFFRNVANATFKGTSEGCVIC